MNNTQTFPSMLKDQTPLSSNEEYVSYDVESLFTNIPVGETFTTSLMKIIIRISYNSSKLIFIRLF